MISLDPNLECARSARAVLSDANALALALVESWPNWTGHKLALIGPSGSGKTHLCNVWQSISGGRIVAASQLAETNIDTLADAPIAVEDVNKIAGNAAAQAALFHLHNLALAEGHSLLLTGTGEPAHWPIDLPDLKSRLQGTTVATLSPPDDTLLQAVLFKLFSDRQLTPNIETIAYLTRHMDRSFAAAQSIVEKLDSVALARRRPITRALAREVLRDL